MDNYLEFVVNFYRVNPFAADRILTENRFSDLIGLLNVRDCSSDSRGITRTVGNEETVVILVGEVVVPRHDFNGNVAHFYELSDDIVLHTAVYGDDLKLAMTVCLDFLCGNLLYQVAGEGTFEIDVLVENNFAEHNTAATELAG